MGAYRTTRTCGRYPLATVNNYPEEMEMIRKLLCAVAATAGLGQAFAAIVVTSEDAGSVSQQYFEQGEFVLMQGGAPAFGVDATGNCWFVQNGQLVSDPCDTVFDTMSEMREQAMSGMTVDQRNMMEEMMRKSAAAEVPEIRSLGSRTIAGYPADCHLINGMREVCLSEKLKLEVEREVGGSKGMEMFEKMGDSARQMAGPNPAAEAVTDLMKQGYPLSDKQKQSAMPGMNPAMLQYLPEDQRAEIMQQMNAAGADQPMVGSVVRKVEKGVSMPDLNLEKYQRITFREFMQQSMRGMGRMPPR